ncbi:MAG: redoxin domain-containing protein [Alistipes sp.]|nr:redoxin domain-containing protein [Alistipes sp.]MBO7195474.1 redoxin domain-containing protein [Alistipes sp.]
MKRIYFVITALILAFTSCQNSKVNINGRFVGSEANMVYLEKTSTLDQKLIDSVELADDGSFVLELEDASKTPTLYNIIFNDERVPLLLTAGENVTINAAGNVLRNYTIDGSVESELLHSFNKEYVEGVIKLNNILSKYTASDIDEQEQLELAKEYTQLRNAIKRSQLRFIVENKQNIAAVYALYQRLPNDQNLFSGDTDVIYYRTVAESIEQSYPESPYLPILRSQIARMDAQLSLLSQVKEVNFPEILMPDMYGNKQSLSALTGKVVLLHFWSATVGNANAMNADLKEIYAKYKEQGFEIYQVAIDTSKALWINAVQEQKLPWISVSDMLGEASPTLGAYNITNLPANFLIDRKGNIVGKDLAGDELEAQIKKLI